MIIYRSKYVSSNKALLFKYIIKLTCLFIFMQEDSPKVSYTNFALMHPEILRFNISVDIASFVHLLNAFKHLDRDIF